MPSDGDGDQDRKDYSCKSDSASIYILVGALLTTTMNTTYTTNKQLRDITANKHAKTKERKSKEM